MKTVRWPRLIAATKLTVLLITGALLTATSRPPDCDSYSAPVVFRASGTCGPGGLVVVEADEAISRVSLANAAALGLPPLTSSQYVSSRYSGKACPFTIEKGEWEFEWPTCVAAADGGSGDGDGGSVADGSVADSAVVDGDLVDGGVRDGGVLDGGGRLTASCLRRCVAHLDGPGGQLLFTCTDARAEVLCESRLTKVVLP